MSGHKDIEKRRAYMRQYHAEHLEQANALRNNRVANGLCYDCGNGVEPGKSRCSYHIAYYRNYQNQRNAAKRLATDGT